MTEKELLRCAYGSDFDLVHNFIDEHNGWCKDKPYNKIDCPRPNRSDIDEEWIREDDGERMVDVYRWRPQALRGFEDNNGWNCIHDHPVPDDVPNDRLLLYFDNGSKKKFSETLGMFEYVTHWRIIEDFPPPLYRDHFTEMMFKEL
ncbi:hypothetical protein SAMN05660862_2539 [Sphingobacterium psychroaquaticum]|uniref:Uncharacterized protein n=2 Tax=Sphingobacterium psychroaquaticum TaxID=561061 RepID=A0A1X7K3Z3_9SPHI|nr:hypothetical protein SAMN05660862_2539 [Sphingobacterium psychroaquaticum]